MKLIFNIVFAAFLSPSTLWQPAGDPTQSPTFWVTALHTQRAFAGYGGP